MNEFVGIEEKFGPEAFDCLFIKLVSSKAVQRWGQTVFTSGQVTFRRRTYGRSGAMRTDPGSQSLPCRVTPTWR